MVHADYGAEAGDASSLETARQIFSEGMKALPTSMLLTFAYADWEESQRKAGAALSAFDNLVAAAPSPLAFVQYLPARPPAPAAGTPLRAVLCCGVDCPVLC